jgi:hypothetical protein
LITRDLERTLPKEHQVGDRTFSTHQRSPINHIGTSQLEVLNLGISRFGLGWKQLKPLEHPLARKQTLGTSTCTDDLKQDAIELSGISRAENQKDFDKIEDWEYNSGPPNTERINTVTFDIPEGIHYKYLNNNTLNDSSYIPCIEMDDRIWKNIKIYLEEYLALGGLNKLILRAPLIEAGHKLPDTFYWDLWGNLEHLRESYSEWLAQEHIDIDQEEEEDSSVATWDTQ